MDTTRPDKETEIEIIERMQLLVHLFRHALSILPLRSTKDTKWNGGIFACGVSIHGFVVKYRVWMEKRGKKRE